jgi:hypothetical protein
VQTVNDSVSGNHQKGNIFLGPFTHSSLQCNFECQFPLYKLTLVPQTALQCKKWSMMQFQRLEQFDRVQICTADGTAKSIVLSRIYTMKKIDLS